VSDRVIVQEQEEPEGSNSDPASDVVPFHSP